MDIFLPADASSKLDELFFFQVKGNVYFEIPFSFSQGSDLNVRCKRPTARVLIVEDILKENEDRAAFMSIFLY